MQTGPVHHDAERDRDPEPPDGPISLSAGDVTVHVDAAAGGRIAAIRVRDEELLVTGAHRDHPMMWGSFPMAPWVGRLRDGQVGFDGRTVRVPTDGSGHALHGTTFARPWTVSAVADDAVSLWCPLGWDFGGTAEQHIEVRPSGVTCTLAVRAGDAAMPAEVGWHPWFRRPARVEFTPSAMYERGPDGLPTGRLVAPTVGPWDDAFTGPGPVQVVRGERRPGRIVITSDCDHWVVFDELDHGVAVEPQSGPADAFHLAPRRLEAGAVLERTMHLDWDGSSE